MPTRSVDTFQDAWALRPSGPRNDKRLLQQRHASQEYAPYGTAMPCGGFLRVGHFWRRSMRVSDLGIRRRHIGRRLVSCLVAYVFALQMVLFAFATPAAAGFAADQDALSAGVCLHDKSAPGAPAQNSDSQEHCKFCPTGSHQAFTAPAPPYHTILRATEAAASPVVESAVRPARTHTTPQPRGPPRSA